MRKRKLEGEKEFMVFQKETLKKYYDLAINMPGQAGHNLCNYLRRLDNVIYRLGLPSPRLFKAMMKSWFS